MICADLFDATWAHRVKLDGAYIAFDTLLTSRTVNEKTLHHRCREAGIGPATESNRETMWPILGSMSWHNNLKTEPAFHMDMLHKFKDFDVLATSQLILNFTSKSLYL